MNNQTLLKTALEVIPYIAHRGNSISEKELRNKFKIRKKDLKELLTFCMYIGYPPYSPDTYFDFAVDPYNPDMLELWIPEKGLLENPINLTVTEAFAIQMLLKVVKRTYPGNEIETLQSKLEKVLSSKRADNIDLNTTIEFAAGTTSNLKEVFSMIEDSLAECKTLQIEYYSASRDKLSSREIAPYQLFNFLGQWYVVAWCYLREEIRHFRIDRIKSIKPGEKEYTIPEDFEKKDTADEDPFNLGISFPADILVLRVSKEAVPELLKEFYYAETENMKSGDVLIKVPLQNKKWLLERIRFYKEKVRVISPSDFKEVLIQDYEVILNKYK